MQALISPVSFSFGRAAKRRSPVSLLFFGLWLLAAGKRRVKASGHFRAFDSAAATLAGYEAMHVLRKGQVAAAPAGNVRAQNRFIEALFGVAA